jgi:ABC-type multidrug transport system ATPase subunit
VRLEARDIIVGHGALFRRGPIDLALDKGAVHVNGANGCGKTTLLRTLCGELRPAQGRVLLDNLNIWTSPSARRQIGYVPAIPELPDFLSVREAYQLMASMRGAPGWDGTYYCDELNLNSQLSLSVASAGQRQKAELIAALAGDPAVLLMDEIFSHLDTGSVQRLSDWIGEWAQTRIIVFTHHGVPPLAQYDTLEMPMP